MHQEVFFLMMSRRIIMEISMYLTQVLITVYKLDTNLKDNTFLRVWLQSPELNGPNGLHIDNSKNKLIVASFWIRSQ